MKKTTLLISLLFFVSLLSAQENLKGGVSVSAEQARVSDWLLVLHGGAGGSPDAVMPQEKQEEYKARMAEALDLGGEILANGGSALDAVEAVVAFLEDCPLFNAGKGAVLTRDGLAELDASIMDGATGKAGAVGAITTVKNPVKAARMVMEKTPHVLLVGDGADQFAAKAGLEIVKNDYFITPSTREKWEKSKHGTVGCVALDSKGNLAAATSTGGMMNKMHGRLGDSPLIGAGTYANNATCAVSATGHGEFFIRNAIAHDLSALIEYRGMALEEAANFIIMEKLKGQGANGGLIAVDRNGNFVMTFNTPLMFRGYLRGDGSRETMVY